MKYYVHFMYISERTSNITLREPAILVAQHILNTYISKATVTCYPHDGHLNGFFKMSLTL